MAALLKIDSIMFYVSNLEKAAKFYEDVLGLKRVWTDEKRGMIGFVFPESDSEIVIHRDSSLPNPCFSFTVANVDEFCKEYQEKGYIIVEKPCEARCGKFAVLEDPDGNKIPIIDLTKFGNKPRYDE
ncbi:MAG: VOC family protein [Thermoproteota archaeon]